MSTTIPKAAKEVEATSQVQNGVQTINVVMKDKSEDKAFNVDKYYGQKLDPQGAKEPTVFLTTRKELSCFLTYNEYIQFKHHNFVTNDQRLIDYLRKHGLFGAEIFEGEYPPHIKTKMEEDRQWITRDIEKFK